MLSDNLFSHAVLSSHTRSSQSASAETSHHTTRMSNTIDAIKNYMISHQLKTGDPLPTEAALCAQLGVSRSSVREALRRLEALDILRSHRGKGSFVGPMTMRPLMETLLLKNALDTSEGNRTISNITQTRLALDLGIAPAVVQAMKGTHNPKLHQLVDAMMKKTQSAQMFPDEDIAFHQGILAYTDNEVMSQLVSSMWSVHQSLVSNLDLTSSTTHENLTITARSHGDMLRAAEAGDLKSYIAAVHQHYAPLQGLIAEALT